MKRSSVVLRIAECLIEPHFPDDPEKEASYILKRLERAGMLPPEAEFKSTGEGCLCSMRESCSSCGGPCNEWEDEDEGS